MQVSENDILGAVKVKDGLFIGDEFAAQDLEFIVTNKVTHIINCAGKQLPNHWEPIGVVYLTLNWMETDHQILFDAKDEVLNELYKFIEGAQNKGEGVLIHSVKGQNRSCCVLAVYFMKKYRWTLYKTLEFLHSRKPNLEIRSNFFSQLMAIEAKFAKQGLGAKTYNWNEVGDDPKNMDSEELLLTNTFLNAKKLPLADFTNAGRDTKTTKLAWADLANNAPDMKSKLITLINTGPSLKKDKNSSSSSSLISESGKTYVKSILKGSGKVMLLSDAEEKNTNTKPEKTENLKNSTVETKPGSGIHKKMETANSHKENKTGMTKSNSVSVLDRAPGNTSIQGNIIHITVNNFINASNGSGTNANNGTALEDAKNSEKPKKGLTASASHKDFTSLLKTKELDKPVDPTKKRGYSPSSASMLNEKNSSKPNFSATFTTNDKEDNNPIFATKIKVNNFTQEPRKLNSTGSFVTPASLNSLKNPSFKSYGQQNTLNQRPATSSTEKKPLRMDQTETKENKNDKHIFSNSGSSFFKYMTQGRTGPVKANMELSQTTKKLDIYEAPGASSSYNNYRPLTAPENNTISAKQKKMLEESPYSAGYNPRSNKNLEPPSNMQRQGSLQPQKESSKAPSANSNVNLNSTANAKARLRSSSPGNSNMTLSYFQEMLNKPKWKY